MISGEHWLAGVISTNGIRILDVLNDVRTDYLCLREARLFRKSRQESPLVSFPEVVVPKQRIALLVLTTREHEAPTKRSYLAVQKRAFHACLGIPGYTVQGLLHDKRRPGDLRALFVRDLGEFFPLTEAVVSGNGASRFTAPLVIVNKLMATFLYAGESPPERHDQAAETGASPETGREEWLENSVIRDLEDAAASPWGAASGPGPAADSRDE